MAREVKLSALRFRARLERGDLQIVDQFEISVLAELTLTLMSTYYTRLIRMVIVYNRIPVAQDVEVALLGRCLEFP